MNTMKTLTCCRAWIAMLLASMFALSHGATVRARMLQVESLRPRRAMVMGRPRIALMVQGR